MKLAGTPAYERMQAEVCAARTAVDEMVEEALTPSTAGSAAGL